MRFTPHQHLALHIRLKKHWLQALRFYAMNWIVVSIEVIGRKLYHFFLKIQYFASLNFELVLVNIHRCELCIFSHSRFRSCWNLLVSETYQRDTREVFLLHLASHSLIQSSIPRGDSVFFPNLGRNRSRFSIVSQWDICCLNSSPTHLQP